MLVALLLDRSQSCEPGDCSAAIKQITLSLCSELRTRPVIGYVSGQTHSVDTSLSTSTRRHRLFALPLKDKLEWILTEPSQAHVAHREFGMVRAH
jgi:hypothetical protein